MSRVRRLRKAIGAGLGAVTGALVVWGAAAAGVDIDPAAAASLAAVLAVLGTYITPANEVPT
jgi:hypothetical protein